MGAVTKPTLRRTAGPVARHSYLKREIGVQRSADGVNFDLRVQACRRDYTDVAARRRKDQFAGRVQLVECAGDVAARGFRGNRTDDMVYLYVATRRRRGYLASNAADLNIAACALC